MANLVLNQATTQVIMEIKNLDKKFRKSCDQILLLNNQIEDLQVRYDRAMKSNRRSFRYSLRLRLATLEGVRNMFYEYASRCADSLELLQNQLINAGGRDETYQENIEWEPVSDDDTLSDIADELENFNESTDSNPESPNEIPSYLYDDSSADSSNAELNNAVHENAENSENVNTGNDTGIIEESPQDDVVVIPVMPLTIEAVIPASEAGDLVSQGYEQMDAENIVTADEANATVLALVNYDDVSQQQQ